MDDHEKAGAEAFQHRRYSPDTRARLYSGLIGASSEDVSFRRGYEAAKRRCQEDMDDDGGDYEYECV